MKKRIVALTTIWLAVAVFIGSGGAYRFLAGGDEIRVVQAGKTTSKDIQKQIEEVNRQRESAEEEKKRLESEIAAMEKKKNNVLEYIETLDGKLTELADKIEENEKEIAKVQVQIEDLRKEIEAAEAAKKTQYETMKQRIKYMYENGNEGYLELLLEAGSLSELFNRVEYVNKVTSYDNNLLINYQKTCDRLQEAKEKLDGNLRDLEELKESLEVEKDSVDKLMDEKSKELANYKAKIKRKNNELASAENLIQKEEDELEALLEAQRRKIAEEAKAREEASSGQDSDVSDNGAGGAYIWPLPVSGRISSYFGNRTSPTAGASSYHKGIDIAVPVGTKVLATKGGTVVTATYSSSAGNYVALYHGGGVYSYYMHCSKLKVGVGEKVSKGQQVALSGNTGISTGPHLHFAIYISGAYVNPLNYVSR